MFGNQLTFFSSIALSRKSRSQLESGVSFILQSLQWPHLDFDYLIQNWLPRLRRACGLRQCFLNSTPEVHTTCRNKSGGNAFSFFTSQRLNYCEMVIMLLYLFLFIRT